MPLILARLTVSGLAIIGLLMLWLFVKQSIEMANAAQRRRLKRHTILLPVEIDGKTGAKGLTDNLSLGGCRMKGNLAIRRGQHLTLRLHLPGVESPIVVERAAVRWVVEKDFGLQFMSIPSSERARLEGVLQLVA
ncbi:MAG TPA: PilZ domain-containing protein [Nitrospira sp.]|nr:PilZ domain-containing protein [Nitrospira sp.]